MITHRLARENIPAVRSAIALLRTGTSATDAAVIISDAFNADGAAIVALATLCRSAAARG